jgi:putative transposase
VLRHAGSRKARSNTEGYSVARYRHWQNRCGPGEVAFVTTTILDFNRIFFDDRRKDLMVRSLRDDCRHYNAPLHAYAVMPHHVHFVVRCPPDHGISWLVQRIKGNSGLLLVPTLDEQAQAGFDQQRGLNRRSFWMRGFRGIAVEGEQMFWDTIAYIHQNPVEDTLCETPEDYVWSSAKLFADGLWQTEEGLPPIDPPLPQRPQGLRPRRC